MATARTYSTLAAAQDAGGKQVVRWGAACHRGLLLAMLLVVVSAHPARSQPTGSSGERPDQAMRSARVEHRPEPPHDRLRFRHLTIDDGLSQNAIYALWQGQQGFMWIGTKDGLNRYDGYSFTTFYHKSGDAGSLSSSYVTALVGDQAGRLWVGTWDGGLNSIDLATLQVTRYAHSPRAQIKALALGPQGHLWIGTWGGGVYGLAPEGMGRADAAFAHIGFRRDDPHGLQDGRVTDLLVDRQGTLWVSTSVGLHRVEVPAAGPPAVDHYPLDLPQHAGTYPDLTGAIYEDAHGRLWVGTEKGLSLFSRSTGRYTHYPHALTGWAGTVMDVAEDSAGRLWLTTPSVLLRFTPLGAADRIPKRAAYEVIRPYPDDPFALSSGDMTRVLRDRSDLMWVGTNGYGVNLYDPRSPRLPTFGRPTDAGKARDFSVRALLEDDAGDVWIGATGLFRWNRRTGEVTDFGSISTPTLFGQYGIWAIHKGRGGALWVGATPGLYRYDPSTGHTRYFTHDPSDPESLPRRDVYGVLESRDGTLWVVTASDLSLLEDQETGRFRHYRHSAPVERYDEVFPSPYEDAQGGIWLGTNQGLARFDPATETFRHYRRDPGDAASLSSEAVRAIYPDPLHPDRYLWIGTAGGGLNRFDWQYETFRAFTVADGLPNNVVYGILPDDAGNLWLSTNRGLSRFNPRDSTFRNYDVRDGLQSNEFNAGAYFRSTSGELFFGGLYGFNYFYPGSLRENPYPPPVVLTGLRLANRPVVVGDSSGTLAQALWHTDVLRLSHADNMITFEFAALDFSAPAKNRYAYRLKGSSDQWIEAGTERTATYTLLPPGRYTFQVRGTNNDGIWNKEGASILLVIAPPWWGTGWAFAVYALVLLALVLGTGRHYRSRRRTALRLEQERLEHENLRALDAARSRFFANVSHEFRTPLTLTIGPLEDLRGHLYGPLTAGATEQVALALRNARRLLRLINQILDAARLEAGQLVLHTRRGDLVPFLHDIAQAFAATAERRRVRYHVELPPGPVWVDFDPDQLDKVFANLLSNAFKFTPEDGTVVLTMALEGRRVAVRVRDEGPGIPADECSHIFDRFYQAGAARHQQRGSGIGLSLAKELTELHGGIIEVESEDGAGSTFTVTLPRMDAGPWAEDGESAADLATGDGAQESGDAEQEPPVFSDGDGSQPGHDARGTLSRSSALSSEIHSPASGSKIPDPQAEVDRTTLLVIDDNTDMRTYIRRHLSPRYRIVEAADGNDALDVARQVLPDLIISDVMMPGLDGFALCEALKQDPALDYIPVILLTARASSESVVEAFTRGADNYVMKPFEMKELVARVEGLIASRQRLRERFGHTPPHPKPDHEPSIPSADEAFVERARTVIAANLGDEGFGVGELAAEVGMSRSQLHRRLRAAAGQSPSDLLRALRLEQAARLLQAQAGLVSEIAYAVGFRSVSYFSTCFHEVYGVAPSAYRGEDSADR